MATIQTTAIVLRIVEFSETSLIVTLLTRDLGRVSAMAKGARRPKGPFEGALDLLAVCRVVVLQKNADVLDLLTEAKLHRRFRGGERSLDRLNAGYHVAEMLRLLTDDADPHPDLYDVTIQTLQQIDGTGDPGSAVLYFDAQLLQRLGHAPGTDQCTDCGSEVESTPRVAFSLLAGGVVCRACRPKQKQVISVRAEVIEQIRMLKSEHAHSMIEVPNLLYGELRAVMNRYIQTVVGSMPKMQNFLPATSRTDSNA
ncbi:MAG: DNA repair protein RecO [Planctomycetota bacterium]